MFTLANAIPVQAGDVIGHYGPGIPIDIGAGTDLKCTGPPPRPLLPGGTITPGGADYPILAQARTYSLAANLAGLRKFVDTLPGVPGVTPFGANNLGQSIPVAVAEEWCSRPEAPTTGCVSADYYEIALVQHREQMHSDLPPTLLREYVQISTTGGGVALSNDMLDGSQQALAYTGVDNPHFLGPLIVATKDRPVGSCSGTSCPLAWGAISSCRWTPASWVLGGARPIRAWRWIRRTRCAGRRRSPVAATPRTAPPSTCTAASRRGSATGRRTSGSPRPAKHLLPEGRQRRTCPTWARPATRDGSGCDDVLLHQPAERPADVLPRPRVRHHPPQRVRRRGCGLPDHGRHGTGADRAGRRARRPRHGIPLGRPGQDVRAGHGTARGHRPPGTPHGGAAGQPVVASRLHAEPEPRQRRSQPVRTVGLRSLVLAACDTDLWAVPNPYYDPLCDPNSTWCEPPIIPGTPYNSSGMEAFHDTPIVNGTAYPRPHVEPKAYRFRILNAANDRFFNLQWY